MALVQIKLSGIALIIQVTILALYEIDKINIGLRNPDSVSCSDAGCDGKLKWQDGSNFVWNGAMISNMTIESNHSVFYFKLSSTEILGSSATQMIKHFACMSSCTGK